MHHGQVHPRGSFLWKRERHSCSSGVANAGAQESQRRRKISTATGASADNNLKTPELLFGPQMTLYVSFHLTHTEICISELPGKWIFPLFPSSVTDSQGKFPALLVPGLRWSE